MHDSSNLLLIFKFKWTISAEKSRGIIQEHIDLEREDCKSPSSHWNDFHWVSELSVWISEKKRIWLELKE